MRRLVLAGFVVLFMAAAARLLNHNDPAVALWSTGWLLVAVGHLPHLRDPLPRPVFSARRLPRA